MKRNTFFVLIASAVTTLCISSCGKDELVRSNGTFIDPTSTPYTIDLVADRWNKIVTGVYTCSFKNCIPPDYRNNMGVKVYVLKADQKILIDYPVSYLGGELSAITTRSDVTINYRCYRELPFQNLRIQVEIK